MYHFKMKLFTEHTVCLFLNLANVTVTKSDTCTVVINMAHGCFKWDSKINAEVLYV